MYFHKQQQNTTTVSGIQITPFGAVENPILLKNLPDKDVYKVDALACLQELWGENILMARQHLYELVSGVTSDEEFQELISSYYKRYAAFANYVDDKYLFGDENVPLIMRIIAPARVLIKENMEGIIRLCKIYGGKYLGVHKDYVYVQLSDENPPTIWKCERVC